MTSAIVVKIFHWGQRGLSRKCRLFIYVKRSCCTIITASNEIWSCCRLWASALIDTKSLSQDALCIHDTTLCAWAITHAKTNANSHRHKVIQGKRPYQNARIPSYEESPRSDQSVGIRMLFYTAEIYHSLRAGSNCSVIIINYGSRQSRSSA